MDDAPPPVAEEIVMALLVRLLRRGVIDQDDIQAMAAEVGDDAGHLFNCAIVEASAPKESDWRAKRARAQFRVVESKE